MPTPEYTMDRYVIDVFKSQANNKFEFKLQTNGPKDSASLTMIEFEIDQLMKLCDNLGIKVIKHY